MINDWYAIHTEDETISGPFSSKQFAYREVHPDERLCIIIQGDFNIAQYIFNLMVRTKEGERCEYSW